MNADWSVLSDALDRLANEGTQTQFWVRDDDAVTDTEALRRLSQWAAGAHTQLLLAVVPSEADASLPKVFEDTPHFIGAVHGWTHKNHAPQTEKKQELGAHRPVEAICAELAEAHRRTVELCGVQCLAVLVPPWNRIAPEVVQRLPELGYRGLSTFSDAFADAASPGFQVQNSHVDIIDWRGTRGGRPAKDLLAEVVHQVELRASDQQPIGILTHHLVHDDAAWAFLDRLGKIVSDHPGANWISPAQVFSARSAPLD